MEKNLGHATAYGYAKSKGYSGTEEEFAELMADYASVGQSAAQSAEQAAASATSASASAQTASRAAQTATSKASEAVTAAGTATTKASEASQSASTASAAATSAGTSAQTATTAADTATAKASEASESATTASTAKTDAESARDAAAQSASEAAASAESIDPETLEHKAYGAYVVEGASGAIASFADGADNIPMKNVLVHIEPVQEGSGDPSPDNVRPITGWTGAKVTRCGKNLCPRLTGRTINGITFTSNADGSLTVSGTATSEALSASAATASVLAGYPVLAKGTYYLSGGNGVRLYAQVKNRDASAATVTISGNQLDNFSIIGTQTAMFTVTKPCCIYVRADILSGETINATAYPMIHLASDTDDTYEPYSGQTYDITFPSEAGTVYGGTLDVAKGELVVDRAMVTFDGSSDESWVFGQFTPTSNRAYIGVPGIDVSTGDSDIADIISNAYSASAYGAQSVLPRITGRYDIEQVNVFIPTTTREEFISSLVSEPLQVVYPLATPITYHLTPQEITSLLGTNNLWADTGDSEVEYRADTKLYITKKITDAVNALS